MLVSEARLSRGIYHIHSDYSYDGVNRLEEIAQWARDHGLKFVLLTEHDLGFTQEVFAEYCKECAAQSGEVLLLPGIEYEVIRQEAIIHIGAIGLPHLLHRSIIEGGVLPLVKAIQDLGGLAILHHPNNIRQMLTQQELESFDLIELWNSKFDCGFAPNFQFLRWLKKMNQQGPYLVSADIHQVNNFDKKTIAFIDLQVSPDTLQQTTIVDSLKQARYRCNASHWTLQPDGTCEGQGIAFPMLAVICLLKKWLFRLARFGVPYRYRKTVYNFVNRSWLR